MKKRLIMCVLICIVFCIAGCTSNTVKEAVPIKFETDTYFSAGHAETKMQENEETVEETGLLKGQEQETTAAEEKTMIIEETKTAAQAPAPTQTSSYAMEEMPIEETGENRAEQSTTQPQTTQEAKSTPSAEQPKEENTTAEEKSAAAKPTGKPQKSFDVRSYVSYAQEYAVSIEPDPDSTATKCWDNPISANLNRNSITSNMQSRLNRYKNSERFTVTTCKRAFDISWLFYI